MNKTQLTEALASRTDIPKTKAAEIVNALFAPTDGIIASTCRGGEKVTVPGFGTWQQKTQKARNGVNPATGAPLAIPEKQVIKFSSGKGLKS